jgi:threonine dehydrogenase-like Zn-dependent dehydrogenase
LPQKCERLFKYGHAALSDGSGLNGTYASHILLRAGTHLVEVPSVVPDAVAASANCSLATMVAVTEHLPQPCRTAVVQGAGLLGLHACALLRATGVARVLVIDPDPARSAKIADFGGEPMAATNVSTGCADVVIEAAGVAGVVAEGLRMLRPGGHYLFAGLVHPDSALEITGETIIRRCLTLRGFHNYAPRHLERAVAFLRETSHLPWATLVSPPVPLEEMNAAVKLAESRRWARVAVTMGP